MAKFILFNLIPTFGWKSTVFSYQNEVDRLNAKIPCNKILQGFYQSQNNPELTAKLDNLTSTLSQKAILEFCRQHTVFFGRRLQETDEDQAYARSQIETLQPLALRRFILGHAHQNISEGPDGNPMHCSVHGIFEMITEIVNELSRKSIGPDGLSTTYLLDSQSFQITFLKTPLGIEIICEVKISECSQENNYYTFQPAEQPHIRFRMEVLPAAPQQNALPVQLVFHEVSLSLSQKNPYFKQMKDTIVPLPTPPAAPHEPAPEPHAPVRPLLDLGFNFPSDALTPSFTPIEIATQPNALEEDPLPRWTDTQRLDAVKAFEYGKNLCDRAQTKLKTHERLFPREYAIFSALSDRLGFPMDNAILYQQWGDCSHEYLRLKQAEKEGQNVRAAIDICNIKLALYKLGFENYDTLLCFIHAKQIIDAIKKGYHPVTLLSKQLINPNTARWIEVLLDNEPNKKIVYQFIRDPYYYGLEHLLSDNFLSRVFFPLLPKLQQDQEVWDKRPNKLSETDHNHVDELKRFADRYLLQIKQKLEHAQWLTSDEFSFLHRFSMLYQIDLIRKKPEANRTKEEQNLFKQTEGFELALLQDCFNIHKDLFECYLEGLNHVKKYINHELPSFTETREESRKNPWFIPCVLNTAHFIPPKKQRIKILSNLTQEKTFLECALPEAQYPLTHMILTSPNTQPFVLQAGRNFTFNASSVMKLFHCEKPKSNGPVFDKHLMQVFYQSNCPDLFLDTNAFKDKRRFGLIRMFHRWIHTYIIPSLTHFRDRLDKEQLVCMIEKLNVQSIAKLFEDARLVEMLSTDSLVRLARLENFRKFYEQNQNSHSFQTNTSIAQKNILRVAILIENALATHSIDTIWKAHFVSPCVSPPQQFFLNIKRYFSLDEKTQRDLITKNQLIRILKETKQQDTLTSIVNDTYLIKQLNQKDIRECCGENPAFLFYLHSSACPPIFKRTLEPLPPIPSKFKLVRKAADLIRQGDTSLLPLPLPLPPQAEGTSSSDETPIIHIVHSDGGAPKAAAAAATSTATTYPHVPINGKEWVEASLPPPPPPIAVS